MKGNGYVRSNNRKVRESRKEKVHDKGAKKLKKRFKNDKKEIS